MTGIKPEGITKAHLRRGTIPEDYWECDFSTYEGSQKAKDLTVKYLKQLSEMKEEGIGIIYVGPHGQGKTTLAMIVMKYLARANWRVYCTSLGEIVENLQKSWDKQLDSDGTETTNFIQRARRADFLLIDDVGKEHRGRSGFVQTVFDNLIRYRVQHRLPTFLTSNLTKSELEGTYGASAISLLEGKLLPVTVTGADYRRTTLRNGIKEKFSA